MRGFPERDGDDEDAVDDVDEEELRAHLRDKAKLSKKASAGKSKKKMPPPMDRKDRKALLAKIEKDDAVLAKKKDADKELLAIRKSLKKDMMALADTIEDIEKEKKKEKKKGV